MSYAAECIHGLAVDVRISRLRVEVELAAARNQLNIRAFKSSL